MAEQSRRDYSLARLQEFAGKAVVLDDLVGGDPLCIYATGSYGRLEAWEESDADLFFLFGGLSANDKLSDIKFIEIAAALISIARSMGFPEFSGDGEYLNVHNVADMDRVLGSPADDSINAFTARMLLILESRPVYNQEVYDRLLKTVIGFYFEDFEDHPEDFLPNFLTNDILRFWRTLTLNYEEKRRKIRRIEDLDELAEKKSTSALRNYKLKFSRMSTCFSMISSLAASPVPVSIDRVIELCAMSPKERFGQLRDSGTRAAELVDQLDQLYEEFLEFVQRPKAELHVEVSDPEERKRLEIHGSKYGEAIFQLINETVDEERMRYLVI